MLELLWMRHGRVEARMPKRAQVALDVLESLLEGCQVIGYDYRYEFVNETVARQAQKTKDELLGRTMSECFPGIEHSAMYEALTRCMKDRAHHRMENEFPLADGSVGYFELRFLPVPEGVCILSVDITQRKRAERQLQGMQEQVAQMQKMDAIGRLAAGVAHDFNNLLSVIISYGGLLRDGLRDNPLGEDATEILKAGERAAELTKQLLAVSRQQIVAPAILDLNEIVRDMDKMLRRLVGADVSLRTVEGSGLGLVKADKGQIEQILLNLAVNARDAMPNGGKLTIETGNVDLDEEYAREHLGTSPGPHVMLAVTDTGTGMDKATQARIFEPFFTTKPAGKGTGLGLATLFGITQQNGGSVWVYSELGKGTCFKVYFPRVTTGAAAEVTRAAGDDGGQRAAAPRGGATILVVEDDAQLRKLARGILERGGYQVLVAATPNEALEIVRGNGRKIDLLLTDVMLPEMNGRELALQAQKVRPEMKLVYMSGYTEDAAVHQGIVESGVKLVQKPLTPAALSRALSEALGY